MAAWVCTKEGRKMESEKKERKWKHVCKRTHQSDEMATIHTTRPNQRRTRLLFYHRVENGSTKQKFNKANRNFLGTNASATIPCPQ